MSMHLFFQWMKRCLRALSMLRENKSESMCNDKPSINLGVNMNIVSLNSQGRKLEECAKYMEDHNIDILRDEKPKIPSKSLFIYKDWICITSTDIQGGEPDIQGGEPPKKKKPITKTKPEPSDNCPVEVLKTKRAHGKNLEIEESNVEYLTRKKPWEIGTPRHSYGISVIH